MDVIGKKFGSLTVIRLTVSEDPRRKRWLCKCDCGQSTTAYLHNLKSGKTHHCGCKTRQNKSLSHIRHGMAYSNTYVSWQSMLQRVRGTNGSRNALYYSTVTVCTRWLQFENFLSDMGKRPEDMTLDRIDNTKGYSPDNCRWATIETQNSNRRIYYADRSLLKHR